MRGCGGRGGDDDAGAEGHWAFAAHFCDGDACGGGRHGLDGCDGGVMVGGMLGLFVMAWRGGGYKGDCGCDR